MADYLDFFNGYIWGIVQMLTGFYFYTGFFEGKGRRGVNFLFVTLGIAFAAWMFSGSMLFLIYILLLTAGGVLVCKADGASALLYAVVTAEIMQLCFGIFNSILCILYPLMVSWHRESAGMVFMVVGNTALLAAVFCYRIVKRHFSYLDGAKNQYAIVLLMPTLLIFFIGAYVGLAIYGDTVVLDRNGYMVNLSNIRHDQMVVVQLLAMASLFCILYAYKKMLESFRLSMELSLLAQQEHFLNRYVDEIKMRYQKTKSFRHDIKNHITIVRELLQHGKTEQALHYIGDMEGVTGELSFSCSTNNPVVDILIGNKLGLAESYGIDVECSLHLPCPCLVRDMDFCIILSNALDNAICACKGMEQDGRRYIRLTGRLQGDFILLEIENSFQEKQGFWRGTGLSNVKAVADKYDGAVHVKVQDSVFILSVLLIIPQHAEDIPLQIG